MNIKSMLKFHCLEVLPFFAVSRILFLLVLTLTSAVSLDQVPAREGVNLHIGLQQDFSSFQDKIIKTLLSADASWYLEIAKYGYPADISSTTNARHWVFFPAFPLVIKTLSFFTSSFVLSAVLLNGIFFLAALSFLSTYLSLEGFNKTDRNFVVGTLCFHPYSYFFSTPHTEAGFFLFLMVVFLFSKYANNKIVLSGALGALLCYRPTGILIYPSLFLAAKNKRSFIVCSIFAGLALAYYFIFLWQLTGSPLAWMVNQKAWGRDSSIFNLAGIYSEIKSVFIPWSFSFLHFIFTIIALSAASFFLLRRNFSYASMILIPFVVVIQTGTLLSVSRILMPIFPIYIFLAILIRNETLRTLCLLSSAVVYGIMCLLYSLNVTLAMT